MVRRGTDDDSGNVKVGERMEWWFVVERIVGWLWLQLQLNMDVHGGSGCFGGCRGCGGGWGLLWFC